MFSNYFFYNEDYRHPSVNRPRKSLHFRDVLSFYSFEKLLYKHCVLARCNTTSIVVCYDIRDVTITSLTINHE